MKTKKIGSTKKRNNSLIAVAIVICIIAAGVAYFYHEKISIQQNEPQWITSGPFSIDNSKYRLGDNVFMVVSNLKPEEAGNIIIVTPKGDVYDKIPFNGTMKSNFHYYFKPNTQIRPKLCTPQDLVGNWKLIFEGVPYKPINFQVTNEWLYGAQNAIKPMYNC